MPKFTTNRVVGHSAERMFDLVADVEAYPGFVPLCERLIVRGRTTRDGADILVADMTIAYKLIRETFTSRVTLARSELKISVTYLDGPFHHMDNIWTFTAVSERQSNVNFSIDYEFKSRILSALMGTVFDRAVHKFSGAFEARADELYGAPPKVATAR